MPSSTVPELPLVQRCTLSYQLWTSLFSALVFACLREHDQTLITELERRSVRRHQRKHFADGMRKLGLDEERNDVLRCARYHYFSNSIGGLPMHYVEESAEKIWIRYLAPYWMGDGPTQPAAGPAVLGPAFGRAPYLGWHANNGAVLGNDRLVFVHTQSLCDGDPWDAGYFTLHDRALPPGQGYLRRVGEWGPPFDPAAAPPLPHLRWPEQRRARALRNYAIDFTASRCSTLAEITGPAEAARIAQHAFTVVLAQRAPDLPETLGVGTIRTPLDAARLFMAVALLNGDEVDLDSTSRGHPIVCQRTKRLWRDEPRVLPEIDDAVSRAWSATLALYGAGLGCQLDRTDPEVLRWRFHGGSDA